VTWLSFSLDGESFWIEASSVTQVTPSYRKECVFPQSRQLLVYPKPVVGRDSIAMASAIPQASVDDRVLACDEKEAI
jgi:hypothetical protein